MEYLFGPIKNEKKRLMIKLPVLKSIEIQAENLVGATFFVLDQQNKASNFKSRYSKLTKIIAIDFDKQQNHKIKQSGITYQYQKFQW